MPLERVLRAACLMRNAAVTYSHLSTNDMQGATTFKAATWRKNNCAMLGPPILGYDSFQGLPEKWRDDLNPVSACMTGLSDAVCGTCLHGAACALGVCVGATAWA